MLRNTPSHRGPLYCFGHLQMNVLPTMMHLPSFKHGFGWHNISKIERYVSLAKFYFITLMYCSVYFSKTSKQQPAIFIEKGNSSYYKKCMTTYQLGYKNSQYSFCILMWWNLLADMYIFT